MIKFDESIKKINKFKLDDSQYFSGNANLDQIRKKLLSKDYEIYEHVDKKFDNEQAIFTLIILIHDSNISYIKNSIESAFLQTYKDTEVILISHGTSGSIFEMIVKYFQDNNNAKLIIKNENKYEINCPVLSEEVSDLWNAALFCSDGSYVYFLACDDYLSDNYCSKMVDLFLDNERCISAGPSIVSVDADGRINEDRSNFYRDNNLRNRYTSGFDLVENYINGGNYINFPGGCLSFKSELVRSLGGFDIQNDISQIFRFAVLGDSGFDKDASLFWRHHEQQSNKLGSKLGVINYSRLVNYYKKYEIEKNMLLAGGLDFSIKFKKYFYSEAEKSALNDFKISYLNYGLNSGLRSAGNIFTQCRIKLILIAILYLILHFPRACYVSMGCKGLRWRIINKLKKFIK